MVAHGEGIILVVGTLLVRWGFYFRLPWGGWYATAFIHFGYIFSFFSRI